MKLLNTEFQKLNKLSASVIITKEYYKHDPMDPIVMNAIAEVNDQDTFIVMEGYILNINGIELDSDVKQYKSQIEELKAEINDNLAGPIKPTRKIEYLDALLKGITTLEEQIEKTNNVWLSKKAKFKFTTIKLFYDFEKDKISEHFYDRKKMLRQLLIFITKLKENIQSKELTPYNPNYLSN